MRNFNKILISGFVLAVLFSFFSFSVNCEDIQNKVVRLHVLANSDSELDQRIKLAVKDCVFEYSTGLLKNSSSPEESEKILRDNIASITEIANKRLKELNAPYQAKAAVGEDYFSTREYDTFTLPAGNYSALKVFIGEGSGKNWWCALYPGLCVSSSAEFTGFTDEEKELVTEPQKYEISFKIYEWYQNFINLFQ